MKSEKYYTIEKHFNLWTLWKNVFNGNGCICIGKYTADSKKKCLDWAKEHNIKIGRNKK